MNITYAFLSAIIVSLISLVGLFTISFKEEKYRKLVGVFVALAVGALLGDAFIHLLPEAFESSENSSLVSVLVIIGILLFFVLEKVLHWHHHGHDETEHDTNELKTLASLVLVSDGFHNLIDGIVIGVSYLISIEVGVATTIAVLLHEIPQEIGDFGILIYSGYSRAKALLLNFISALLAVLGVALVALAGNQIEGLINWVLPLTAGMFIYIASSDLVPELHKKKDWNSIFSQVLTIAIGVLAMYFLRFLE